MPAGKIFLMNKLQEKDLSSYQKVVLKYRDLKNEMKLERQKKIHIEEELVLIKDQLSQIRILYEKLFTLNDSLLHTLLINRETEHLK